MRISCAILGVSFMMTSPLTTSPAILKSPSKTIFDVSARWIWDGGPEKPVDAYRLFRKAFNLDSKPSKAILKITADAEYRLFVNGEYVGRGPAPNPPAHISVDEIDIGKRLHPGKNSLGVIVYHLGIPSFPRMLGRAGLIAQLDIPSPKVVTDSSWRWHEAWWEPTGEKFSPFREFTEHLDARKEPSGWTNSEFDDGSWQAAVEIGPSGSSPWQTPESRDILLPGHHVTLPAGILFQAKIDTKVPPKKEAAAQLATLPENRSATQLSTPASASPTARIRAETVLKLTNGDVIAFDFGREVSGFPEIEADAEDGTVLDIGYGEGIEKDGHIGIRRQGNPDCDRMTLRKGRQTLRVFHHRAFRYMVIANRGGKSLMKTPRIIESGYPNKDRGFFSCSDPRLSKIWEVGRHTMRICMDQGFMDCPWRERGQYIGDGLAEGPVALYAFGDTTLMRRFLRQAQFCQPADGLLEPAYPCDWTIWHGSRGPNRIPGYGLLWVVMLEQYYRNTGDVELVKELGRTMDKLLAWFEPHRAPDGLLRTIPEWNFIDWVRLSDSAGHACLNLQYLMALKSAAALDRAAGRQGHWTKEVDRVARSIEAALWDETRGLYRDDPGHYSEHTNALALLTLVNDPLRAKRIIDQLGAPDLVKPESPYFEGFVLRALCKYGRQDEALRIIRDKWGHMVDEGATTFWEGFSMQTSMCHAWSCTPTALLSEEILGVRYDAPSRTVTFAPNSLDLKWAKGAAPMKCGDVVVSWESENGKTKARISAPKGVLINVPSSRSRRILNVDGKPVDRIATLKGGIHEIDFQTD